VRATRRRERKRREAGVRNADARSSTRGGWPKRPGGSREYQRQGGTLSSSALTAPHPSPSTHPAAAAQSREEAAATPGAPLPPALCSAPRTSLPRSTSRSAQEATPSRPYEAFVFDHDDKAKSTWRHQSLAHSSGSKSNTNDATVLSSLASEFECNERCGCLKEHSTKAEPEERLDGSVEDRAGGVGVQRKQGSKGGGGAIERSVCMC